LDMGHTLRGERIQEEEGKGRKSKPWKCLLCLL
jgi:hypothetical protein